MPARPSSEGERRVDSHAILRVAEECKADIAALHREFTILRTEVADLRANATAELALVGQRVEAMDERVKRVDEVGLKNLNMLEAANDTLHGERDPEGRRDLESGVKHRTTILWRERGERQAQGRIGRYLVPSSMVGVLVLQLLQMFLRDTP